MTTTSWNNEELSRIGEAEELQLASERRDGTLRPYVTMWVVRAGSVTAGDAGPTWRGCPSLPHARSLL